MTEPITIDLVHDLVCPWCRVGEHNLDAALALRPDVPVKIRLHAFQLAPEVPTEGVDYREHLKKKFGNLDRLDAVNNRLVTMGKASGINFNFDKIQRLPNTLRGHAMIAAAPDEFRVPLLRALQQAYFENGEDIGADEVLVRAGIAAGLTEQASREALENIDLDATRKDAQEMTALGITGVPAFIFDRRFLVSGAQPPEQIVRAIDQAARPSIN